MDPNQNIEQSTATIISDILKRYNLFETDEELTKKFFVSGVESNGETIFWTAANLVDKKMSEQDVFVFLKEHLKISDDIAKQILNEIIKSLLPAFATANLEKIPKIKTPVKRTYINVKKEEILDKKEKLPKKSVKPKIENKSDNYREPIE